LPFSLIQYRQPSGERAVAAREGGGSAIRLLGVSSVLDLASQAVAQETSLDAAIREAAGAEVVDLESLENDGPLLAPIDHPEPARLYLTGTGLTHLGSAEGRDQMHRSAADATQQTDSMKMFRMGLEGGKPQPGATGIQPEWFYKGNGSCVAAPGGPIVSPAFALDAGEEPEIAGVYLIGPDGTPLRLGFCLANEFSDHVTERVNYLWLAHSKLRQAALGPELLTGALPPDVRGVTRIVRHDAVAWEKPFLSGEDNMSHSIENLERHHFKYPLFRRPGDIHVHFFGTATLSFSDGFRAAPGDVFEIAASPFRMPLRNTLVIAPEEDITIRAL
jgi:hypothetical protein